MCARNHEIPTIPVEGKKLDFWLTKLDAFFGASPVTMDENSAFGKIELL